MPVVVLRRATSLYEPPVQPSAGPSPCRGQFAVAPPNLALTAFSAVSWALHFGGGCIHVEPAARSVSAAMKAVLLSARWEGWSRRLGLAKAASASDDSAQALAENLILRDRLEFLTERLACAQRRLKLASLSRRPPRRATDWSRCPTHDRRGNAPAGQPSPFLQMAQSASGFSSGKASNDTRSHALSGEDAGPYQATLTTSPRPVFWGTVSVQLDSRSTCR